MTGYGPSLNAGKRHDPPRGSVYLPRIYGQIQWGLNTLMLISLAVELTVWIYAVYLVVPLGLASMGFGFYGIWKWARA